MNQRILNRCMMLCLVLCLGLTTGPAWGFNVAVFQYNSYFVMDQGVEGILEGLRNNGFVDGENLVIKFYNAGGDKTAADSLAAEIVQQDFDLILTCSTPCMQAIYNVNQETKIPQVFSVVAWAYTANVGIGDGGSLDKPEFLTGISSPNPVDAAIQYAKAFFPPLQKLGLIWNPEEANSVFNTSLAREACPAYDIELLEENVSQSSQVIEKANLLTAQGVQAFLVGGDSTVLFVLDDLVSAAQTAGVPVFTVNLNGVNLGALFDLGPDFYDVGIKAGNMAAQILNGTSPKDIPLEDYVPQSLFLNPNALEGLESAWNFTDEALNQADKIIGSSQTDCWEIYR
jgi:putative tryptophan/tyrosine transport system substrate-binding protein